MKNLGDRLKEARNSKGVSLRDAADATKIRSDFISHMELGDFDFDLPEVYKRGFLRLYASFLKLDVDSVMTDYNGFVLGKNSKIDAIRNNQAKAVLLGKITAEPEEPIPAENRYDNESKTDEFPGGAVNSLDADKGKTMNPYAKKAILILVGSLSVLILIFFLKFALKSKSSPLEETHIPTIQGSDFILSIEALNDSYLKISYEANPDDFLILGSMNKGETKTLNLKNEPVMVLLLDAKSFRLKRNNEILDLKNISGEKKFRVSPPKKPIL